MAKLGARGAKLKENYRRLREAGFSSADATRFRGASEAEIQKAIANKALPQLREEKRTALKIKAETKEYKSSQLKIVEVKDSSETYLKKLVEYYRKAEKDGYNYFSVRTTLTYNTGEEEVFQTGMMLTKSITDVDSLVDVLTQEVETFLGAYSFDDRRIVKINVEVLFWKAKK